MPSSKKIVDKIITAFREQLEEAMPQLNEAVQRGDGEASVTATVQIKRKKKGRFAASLKTRVRAPLEPVEFDCHLDGASGQLDLGFDEKEHGIDDGSDDDDTTD